MSQLITLNNIDSDAVDSLAALVTDNATLDGVTTLGAATETVSLPPAPPWSQQAKIQASDAQAEDTFGQSVSISSDGNTAIVGAYLEDTGASSAGAAYIFVRSGTSWTQQAKIQASNAGGGDFFGKSVSISSDGNTAIVGANGEDTGASDAGAAYIFVRSGSTWSQQALIAGFPSASYFGDRVTISGDGNTAIIGAWIDQLPGITNAGGAYIFTRSGTTWSQQARLQISDPEAGDLLGEDVSISSDGNTAIVGVARKDTGASDSGAAYIFVRSGSTWSQQAKVQPSVPLANGYFGKYVSISGDGNTAIAGTGSYAQVYIFTRSGTNWSEQTRIAGVFPAHNISFSISSDGNAVVIGTSLDDTGATDAGAAYIYKRSGTTWTETQKIQASDAEAGDNFGSAVGISGNGLTAIVGALNEDTGGLSAGAAYVFSLPDPTFDISQSSIFSHSGLTADFTANFTNVPTIDNRTISAALILEQGATGYLPTVVQIDGVDQTILWQGAVVPVPSINASDIVRFTLLRFGGTWSVLASLIKFGSV